VAEKNIAANTDENCRTVVELLTALGITVNCRFIRDASTDDIRGFRRAPLNLLAYDDHFGRVLRRFFTDRYGSVFAENPFPVGRFETAAWLREIAAFFGLENQAEALVSRHETRYRQRAERLKAALAGKRLMIVSYNHNVDWLIEAAVDTGMAVAKVGVLNYTQDSVVKTRFSDTVPFETGYDPKRRAEDIQALRPHLVLSNYAAADLPETARYDTLPLCPDTGFSSGLVLASRWARVLSGPPVEGWKHDRRLLS
jgi:nitrogenase molybdenum-iron protein alpha/beta subunit